VKVTFRPLPDWPYTATSPRQYSRFRADYRDTQVLLEYEIDKLDGTEVVFGIGLRERDVRLDGQPRADARPISHPGVEISFNSRHGRLVYATDTFDDWHDNVRAIALSLEALRAVDRYGVSKRGQQYAGWAQLTAGGPDADRGKVLVERAGTIRQALMRYHPDHGGDARDFADVQAYRQAVGL
jgi:hypothetical protein